jgi:hypothetical protein
VDKLPRADAVEAAIMASDALMDDCAVARPTRADTMVDLEKYILNMVLSFVSNLRIEVLLVVDGLRENGYRRLAL